MLTQDLSLYPFNSMTWSWRKWKHLSTLNVDFNIHEDRLRSLKTWNSKLYNHNYWLKGSLGFSHRTTLYDHGPPLYYITTFAIKIITCTRSWAWISWACNVNDYDRRRKLILRPWTNDYLVVSQRYGSKWVYLKQYTRVKQLKVAKPTKVGCH